jgi:TonB-linked SusC/RagA family outer membrane protein
MCGCPNQPDFKITDFPSLKIRRNFLFPGSAIQCSDFFTQKKQVDTMKRRNRITNYILPFCIFLFFSITSLAQLKLTGVITGSNGLPLEGATIVVKGTNISSVTAADGSFSLTARSGNILEISFIGFKTQQIKISNETNLKITLQATVVSLDEVVLTGYTSQKVKEITGSVAIVKPKDITAIPAGQVEQMLQGRVAGLNVITSGQPGAASNVRLHGIGNFGDVTPLYIIDGVQGNINNLNPNDIESLQVLKDAGAYAIYGVRGANGVIIITTHKGKNGKTKISYDFYAGTQQPLKNGPDLLNPQEQADLTWIAYKNANQVGSNGNPNHPLYGNGTKPVLPDYFIADQNLGLFANDPRANPDLYNIDFTNRPIYQIVEANKTGTDWFHELFKPAFSQNHSLTVSGANEKNKYLFSFGYLNQQGTALNTYLKRYTARINTEFAVTNNIRIGENLQLAYRDNPRIASQRSSVGLFNEILQSTLTNPIIPVYDIKGGWAHLYPGFFDENSVAMRVIAKDDKTNSWEVFGNAFAEIDFLKNFTARSSFGGSLVNYYSTYYYFITYNPGTNGLPNNSLNESSGYRRSWTWTNTLKFSKTFGHDHRVNALAGIEAIDNYNREVGGKRSGFFTNDINYRFLSNGIPSTQSNYSFASTSTLNSFISQADYSFKEKLFLKGTLRRDGSSFFGPQHRYGWFPSVSAAWRITEEKFLEKFDWLTDLKLKASWGKTGFYGNTDPFNQYTLYGGTIGDAYYDIYGTSNSAVQGFRAVRLGDPNTGWQEDIVTNIGFESVFWNGKLIVTADWYNKKAKGLLFPVTLPDVLGGAIPPNINVGIVQNKGVDLLLGSKGSWTKNWQWDAIITLTTYKNKILKLNNLAFFTPPFETGLGYVRNETGHPASSFYGYKIIGIFKDADEVSKAPMQNSAAPGRFRYLDANKDNVINASDRVYFGNANPEFTAGINIGINYKNFDFSIFCYGSFGNDVINYPKTRTDFFAIGVNNAKSKSLLYNSWTPQQTNASIPIIENRNNFSNQAIENSYSLEDGSYFRNKSVILGYTLPKDWLRKMKLEKMRVYVQAVNLFTITKYTGFDPELPGQSAAFGIDYANYPNNQKQYLFGVSIGF